VICPQIRRAVSGAAIYVSDRPGQHDFELLRRMVFPDGTVLRALQPALPTRDCLFNDVLRDGKSLLKVWNVNRYCGILAVFNLQGSSWDRSKRQFFTHDSSPKPLSVQVMATDVEDVFPPAAVASPVVAYSYSTKKLHLLQSNEPIDVSLKAGGSDVLTFSPVLKAGGFCFAPVGLSNMYNSGGAVLACSAASTDGIDSVKFTTTTRTGGVFLAYCNTAPAFVRVDGAAHTFKYDANTATLQADLPHSKKACDVVVEL